MTFIPKPPYIISIVYYGDSSMKYKNKDGIELNIGNMSKVGKIGNSMDLVQEVVGEAIRILKSHNHFDSDSKSWALDRGIHFLETNFDLEEKYESSE